MLLKELVPHKEIQAQQKPANEEKNSMRDQILKKANFQDFQTSLGVKDPCKHTSLCLLLSPYSNNQTNLQITWSSVPLSYHRFIQKLLNFYRRDNTMVYYKAWQVFCHFTSTLQKRKQPQNNCTFLRS